MRILVVGAGAIGGYYGGRLLQKGEDVTFLVRERRKGELERDGLVVESPVGDMRIANPPAVLAGDLRPGYDLVLLSPKAYDLESAIESFAPAMGAQTSVMPLLNGLRHVDVLEARFGKGRVLGGLCKISTTLQPGGRIVQFGKLHMLTYGELDGQRSARVEAIEKAFAGANFEPLLVPDILQEMWEKWVFIAVCAGITCLMRASIGDVVTSGGEEVCRALYNECAAVAARQGHAPRDAAREWARPLLASPRSQMVASMARDIERGAMIEADHLVGDLLRRGEKNGVETPLLRIVNLHLQSYLARREREAAQ
ncbi:MAG: 2-dehydropantoate 2-reductase [Acidobacteriota bacterium]|nr:2-dehydropantoate 2-reductase [Acidobacteriota bacterium]